MRVNPEQWPEVLKELRAFGWRTVKGRLTHPWPVAALREGRHMRRLHAARGHSRWRSAGKPQDPNAEGAQQQMNSSSPGVAHPTVNGDAEPVPSTNTVSGDERLTRSGSPRKGAGKAEKAFLQEVLEAFETFSKEWAAPEMRNWGGWWRNRFRENRTKAQRVLAEVRGMIRERRILTNPGATAVDLWGRLP